jgi:hypothetical protein
MKIMRLIPPLTILAVTGAVASSAHAADQGSPPLTGGVHCDGPARFFAMPDFAAMTPQSRDLTVAGGHTALTIGRVRTEKLTEAGTLTVRPRISKLGLKISRKYRKTSLIIGLAAEREDGSFWRDPGDWGRTVMVR